MLQEGGLSLRKLKIPPQRHVMKSMLSVSSWRRKAPWATTHQCSPQRRFEGTNREARRHLLSHATGGKVEQRKERNIQSLELNGYSAFCSFAAYYKFSGDRRTRTKAWTLWGLHQESYSPYILRPTLTTSIACKTVQQQALRGYACSHYLFSRLFRCCHVLLGNSNCVSRQHTAGSSLLRPPLLNVIAQSLTMTAHEKAQKMDSE